MVADYSDGKSFAEINIYNQYVASEIFKMILEISSPFNFRILIFAYLLNFRINFGLSCWILIFDFDLETNESRLKRPPTDPNLTLRKLWKALLFRLRHL